MQLTIREPGSAITHFIGCLMALIAASPLLIKAHGNATYMLAMTIFCHKYGFIVRGKHNLSQYLSCIYQSTPEFSEAWSHDDLRSDCRILYPCLHDHPGRQNWIYPSGSCMGNCSGRNHCQRTLDHLSEMVFFHHLHCHGLDVPAGICPAVDGSPACRIWLAFSGRHHLHHRWCNLCSETSGI